MGSLTKQKAKDHDIGFIYIRVTRFETGDIFI